MKKPYTIQLQSSISLIGFYFIKDLYLTYENVLKKMNKTYIHTRIVGGKDENSNKNENKRHF